MRTLVLASGLLLAISIGGLWAWEHFIEPDSTMGGAFRAAAEESPGTEVAAGSCEVAYYRNPMGLPDISHEPKKDSMGMDYIAVCAEEADTSVVVLGGRQQVLGVTLVQAQRRNLVRQIAATGLVEVNQRTVSTVAPRVEGWIEDLLVDAPGDKVVRGAPLARVYSPELIQTQVNYRVAVQDGTAKAAGLAERLRLLGLADSEIVRLANGGDVEQTAVLVAPNDGTVMQKLAMDGMYFAAGAPLLEIADLSVVWVIAEVYERDLALIAAGARVGVTIEAYPGQIFPGTVQTVLPEIMLDTRTAQVRIEMANAEGLLRPGMFARVQIEALVASDAIVVPRSTVLDAGSSQVVLVALGDGKFQARRVVLGAAADGLIEIKQGLQGGEDLVESVAFLIDAESSIRAALQAFASPPPAQVAPPVGQTP